MIYRMYVLQYDEGQPSLKSLWLGTVWDVLMHSSKWLLRSDASMFSSDASIQPDD
jgi:hypothetical protein